MKYIFILNATTYLTNTAMVLNFLSSYNISVDPKILTQFWMLARKIKGMIFTIIYTFGFSYIVYYFINKNGWNESFNLLKKGIYLALVFIFSYSIIEVFYLAGNQTATDLLVKITPLFHDIKNNGTWWPPLLWHNQLRSIFAEPSYFGMYAALASPILWVNILNKKNKIFWLIISGAFAFLVFTTQSRTANLLFFGELFLLMVFLIYYYGKRYLRELSFILCISLAMFLLSANFISKQNTSANYLKKMDTSKQNTSANYFKNNVTSVIGTSKRSNNSRYAIIIGNVKLGLDYPILGVGYGLNSEYLPEYFPKKLVKNNHEIENWVHNMKEKGVLKSSIPNIGEYVCLFSETGIIGLAFFLIPWLYILIKIPNKIKNCSESNRFNLIGFYIAFIAAIITGLGDHMRILYVCWILLAFAYALVWNENKSVKEPRSN